jgi:hypothetical protein
MAPNLALLLLNFGLVGDLCVDDQVALVDVSLRLFLLVAKSALLETNFTLLVAILHYWWPFQTFFICRRDMLISMKGNYSICLI